MEEEKTQKERRRKLCGEITSNKVRVSRFVRCWSVHGEGIGKASLQAGSGQVLVTMVRASIGSGQAAASLCRLGQQQRSVSQAVVPHGTSGAVCFAFVYKYQMKIEIQKSVHVAIEMEHILYLPSIT